MRTTLRRSCNACAKAKHSCDLRTPRCSRCIKRKVSCVYANEPLTSPPSSRSQAAGSGLSSDSSPSEGSGSPSSSLIAWNGGPNSTSLPANAAGLVSAADSSFDPFDSYPPTRLPRPLAQRLIQHFLSSIAFQYYPLDLNLESNPFVVSWWPLALADPALFHVSLQTASLDEERREQKGFPVSELLMMDSVSLVRQRVGDKSSAYRDETMNSVVTLAAIEYGKGNVEVSRMHIEGVKRMVGVRGGIAKIRRTSPLTVRMIAWVALLVTGRPQFQVQDDLGFGDGVAPIPQWQLASTSLHYTDRDLIRLNVDSRLKDILMRLRVIFHHPGLSPLTNTELHDLTCYVVHRLLLLSPLASADSETTAASDCLRCGMVLYMLVIHGTTYYSHADLAEDIASQLRNHIDAFFQTHHVYTPMLMWVLSSGTAATSGKTQQWFIGRARVASKHLSLTTWGEVLPHLQSILWIKSQHVGVYQQIWENLLEGVEGDELSGVGTAA